MRPLAILSLVLAWCPLHAQDNPLRLPDFRSIDPEAAHLMIKGDSAGFNALHAKFDSLVFDGQGRIDIVHIGGSHVQADMWSMQLRHRLQTMVPGARASRGFLFPYNIAKSNNPYWYHPEYTGNWTSVKNVMREDTSSLGLSGYAVTTTDPLTTLRISFRGTGYSGYDMDRVRVYHRMDSSFTVGAAPRDSSVQWSARQVPEQGFTELTFSRPLDTLELRFTRTDSTQRGFTLYGIDLRNGDPGITLHAAGVNGATTTSWLRCQRMPAELATLAPDLVVLSIGINDAYDSDFSVARFERNYEELIQRIRKAVPGVAILLTTNNDSYVRRRRNNTNAPLVRDAMLRLGEKHGCAVWDLYGAMGGATAMRRWQSAGLAKSDRVHFTREGYVMVGDMLFTALMEDYAAHLRRTQRQHAAWDR
jgi:lysophospholipase L1-like esterase